MKPASQIEIRYGHGCVKRESSNWPRYLAVTSPHAYQAAYPYLTRQPVRTAFVDWCDCGYLQGLCDDFPDDAELVVGLGGGRAMDASKFVALVKHMPLILVPTAVSSGAIIHGVFPRWRGRLLCGRPEEWPWVDCQHVLVDYDLTLEAPVHLNTAGIGDILCSYAGLAEWRRNSNRGLGQAWDQELIAPAIQHHERIVHDFPQTLDQKGDLTPESVHYIMKALQERDSRAVNHSAAPHGDHLFLHAIELVNEKAWIHGEVVSLGAMIIAWLCREKPEILASRLDTCRARWRPTQIGISREELLRGLTFIPEYLAEKKEGNHHTILREKPIVGPSFDRLWKFLKTEVMPSR